eukprot:gnl/Chilomastix_cuspidata/2657.p1 GENE.gnl/Chilomastix_cuspidata/2657~~gnl/Chilomastix_cuspidata/2657.p1  ORF type:complete len:698 (-),score=249.90 gnl/Chilomastix_cuspidata/2657:124-2196(-)
MTKKRFTLLTSQKDQKPKRIQVDLEIQAIGLERGGEKIILKLTCEADPFFFFFLEIDELSFHKLKEQQKLTTNFMGFPDVICQLADLCITSEKHYARFTYGGSVGSLEFVDEGGYRITEILSLVFNSGEEDAVRQHIVEQIDALKHRNAATEAALLEEREKSTILEFKLQEQARARDQIEKAHALELTRTREEMQKEVADVRAESSRIRSELSSARQAAELRVQRIEQSLSMELRELRERFAAAERDRDQATRDNAQLCQQLEAASQKNATADADAQTLRQTARDLEKVLSEVREKLSATEARLSEKERAAASLQADVASVRASERTAREAEAETRARLREMQEKATRFERDLARESEGRKDAEDELGLMKEELERTKAQLLQTKKEFRDAGRALQNEKEALEALQRSSDEMQDKLQTLTEREKKYQETLAAAANREQKARTLMRTLSSRVNELENTTRHAPPPYPRPAHTYPPAGGNAFEPTRSESFGARFGSAGYMTAPAPAPAPAPAFTQHASSGMNGIPQSALAGLSATTLQLISPAFGLSGSLQKSVPYGAPSPADERGSAAPTAYGHASALSTPMPARGSQRESEECSMSQEPNGFRVSLPPNPKPPSSVVSSNPSPAPPASSSGAPQPEQQLPDTEHEPNQHSMFDQTVGGDQTLGFTSQSALNKLLEDPLAGYADLLTNPMM